MTHRSFKTDLLGFIGWLAASAAACAIGAWASLRADVFYAQLSQPSWAPPASLFGPVWLVLYFLMAVAAWLVWRGHGFRGARTALWLFIIQLVANALWSWLFFVLHNGALSLAEIVVLWALIVATLVAFWRLHKFAAVLLLPYLAWVSFATLLTFSLWRKNPAILG